ncbi:beta-lactamase class A [Catenuloplanes nepalensis]|uniref:Beta-lactamase class A n=1 Tax=Catenuloplanes nepalensis TaxID=587533 RepID=A0ABT9N0B6_9ACTN|nr:serine hydrolase [Catenuloplanes nepalensis]MDP9796701.1 beta-lactamase class A [Catenuloplanes nepalensis]
MPRIPFPSALLTAAVVAVVTGSVLSLPAPPGDGTPAAEAEVVAQADPRAEARRAWDVRAAALTAALAAEDAGVAVIDNSTGFTFGHLGDVAFESASVAKVGILAAVLLLAQDQDRELTATETRLATRMIGVSDNDAASTLYAEIGAVAGLGAATARLGLTDTVPDESWGLTRTTPDDQARLVSALLMPDGAFSAYSRQVAEDLMTSIDPDQDWGVGAAAAPGERVALKNGWLSRDTEDGTWIANSVGRITGASADLTLVVLSHGNAGYQTGVDRVERLATLTRATLAL